MQDFSPRDSVLVLLAPISCCLPSARQNSAQHPSFDPAPWYSPLPCPDPTPFDPDAAYHAWHASSSSRRPADLVSLHSTRSPAREAGGRRGAHSRGGSRSPDPVARRRPRGAGAGDVSGTGVDSSSGLSRWTLIKAWMMGDAKGRIRLESDEEGEMGGIGSDGVAGGEDEGGLGLGVALGEGDARVLTPTEAEDFDWLSGVGREVGGDGGEDSFEGMGVGDRFGQEEGGEEERRAEEKAARRARRQARRRARELGLTLEEFDEGVAVGDIPPPSGGDLLHRGEAYLSAHSGSDRHLASSYGASSSGSSRSGSRRHRSHQDSHDHSTTHQLHDEDHDLQPPRLPHPRPRHHKRLSLSASSEPRSEARSGTTSSSSRSRRSASTLATTAEGPRTPLVVDDGFTQEDWETASARGGGGGKARRSKSQRRRERELSGVREGVEGED